MQQRRPAREHLRVAPGHAHQNHIQQHHQPGVVLAEPRLAQRVIYQPAKGQRRQRDHHRLPGRKLHHFRIDQVELGPEVVDQHQQGKAGKPCRIAFPFEPDQVFGQARRGDHVFLDMIEAPAMHLPFFAVSAGRQVGRLAQAKVQRDEVERRPDPGDGRDHMRPAHRHLDPCPQHRDIVHPRDPSEPDSEAYARCGRADSGPDRAGGFLLLTGIADSRGCAEAGQRRLHMILCRAAMKRVYGTRSRPRRGNRGQ